MARAPAPPKPIGDDTAKSVDKTSGAFTKAFGASAKLTKGVASLGGAAKSLASGALPTASQAMSGLGNAAGGLATEGAQKLSDALSKLGPEGAAAGAAIQAAAAVFAGTVGVLSDLAGIAIEVTQNLDLMRDRFNALAGSAAGGKAVTAAVDKLSASLPFAKSQVEDWATSLLKAGVSADQLEDRIKAVAAAEALSKGGGAAAESFFKRLGEGGPAATKFISELAKGSRRAIGTLKDMGVTMEDLGGAAAVAKMSAEQLSNAVSKALQKKGKGPLEDMALTLPAILQKAREGFLSLFAKLGPAVKPFMKAVKELFGNFNKGTPIIKTLQGVVTKVFTVIFGIATKVVHAISVGVKAMAAVWKFVAPAVENLGKALGRLFGKSTLLATLGKIAKVVFGYILTGVTTAIGAFVMIVNIITAVINVFDSLSSAVGGVMDSIGAAIDGGLASLSSLADGAMSAGADFISGLVGGIASGAGAVIDAVKNLASSALGAFKSVLGIASPSKVMAKMGGFAAEGAAQGLDAGAGRVEDSAAALGGGVKSGAAKGMAGAGGKGGGKGISIGELHLHVADAGKPQQWAEEAFAAFMERLAVSQGAA